MTYPNVQRLKELTEQIELYAKLKVEYGGKGIAGILGDAEKALRTARTKLERLPVDPNLEKREPNDLPTIRALRPKGPRRLWEQFDKDTYLDRLEGALLGRLAGCTLGAPVEFWPMEKMQALAEERSGWSFQHR